MKKELRTSYKVVLLTNEFGREVQLDMQTCLPSLEEAEKCNSIDNWSRHTFRHHSGKDYDKSKMWTEIQTYSYWVWVK